MAGSVVITPAVVPVVPGTTGTCSVRIRNTGTVVDQFSVTMLGQPAAWTTAAPAVLSLFPGAEGTIELHFAPPRAAGVGFGAVPFGVRVDASQDPDGSVVEEGEVDLLAFADLQAKLTPRTSETKRKARHEVLLDNRGNAPLSAALDATDPDEVLAFELKSRTVEVPAGGTARVPVNVAARSGFLRGTDKRRPFQVIVRPEGAQPPITLDGALVQKPGMPKFILPLVGAAVIIALAAIMLPAFKKEPGSGKLSLTSEGSDTTTTAAPAAAPVDEAPAPDAPATAEEAAAAAEAERAANGKDPGAPAAPGGPAASGTGTEGTGDPTTGGGSGANGTIPVAGGDESSAVTSPTATTAPPPATTTTKPPPGVTTTTAPPYAKFVGTWKNTNASTGFEPQTVIRADATSLWVHGYGACSPSYCDWGEGKTTLSDGADNEINVSISTSNGVVKQRITFTSAGQLTIHSDKYTTAGAYWYSADETFNKAA